MVVFFSAPISVRSAGSAAGSSIGFWSMISAAAAKLLAGLELALGVDDLGPLLALGLGLPGHRPLHRSAAVRHP